MTNIRLLKCLDIIAVKIIIYILNKLVYYKLKSNFKTTFLKKIILSFFKFYPKIRINRILT